MSITAERLRVDVEADTSKAEKDVSRFSRGLEAPAKGFGLARAAAGAFAASAVAAFAGKVIMAGSDLNEQISKTGVVFGPATDAVVANAQRMADAFGLPKTEILDAAGGIGLVAKASGLSQTAAAGMANKMAQLAADASSFYNVPLPEALAAMKSGLVGEAEPLRAYGVLLNEASVKAEAHRLGLKAVKGELTEGQKVQARSSLIMKGMADASGDLTRTQDGVANRLREVAGRAKNAAASLGTALLPAVSAALGAFISAGDSVSGFMKSLANSGPVQEFVKGIKMAWDVITSGVDVAQGLGETLDFALGNTGKFVGPISAIAGAVMSAFTVAKDWVGQFATVLLGLAQQALPYVQSAISTVVTTVGQFISAVIAFGSSRQMHEALGALQGALAKVIPVVQGFISSLLNNKPVLIAMGVALGLMIAPIPMLIAAFVAAYAKVDWFRNMVNGVVTFIIGRVVPAFIEFALGVVRAVQGMAGPIGAGIGAITGVFGRFIGWVKPVWSDLMTVLGAVVKVGMAVIHTAVEVGLTIVRTAWTVISNVLRPIVSGLWTAIQAIISGGMAIIGGIVKTALALLTGNWSAVGAGLKSIVSGIWTVLSGLFRGGATAVVGVVKGIPGSIAAVFTGAASILSNVGGMIVDGLVAGIKGAAGRAVDAAKGLANSVADAAKGALNINSPSKVFIGIGDSVVEGLVTGILRGDAATRSTIIHLTDTMAGAIGEGNVTVSAAMNDLVGSASVAVMKLPASFRKAGTYAVRDLEQALLGASSATGPAATAATKMAEILTSAYSEGAARMKDLNGIVGESAAKVSGLDRALGGKLSKARRRDLTGQRNAAAATGRAAAAEAKTLSHAAFMSAQVRQGVMATLVAGSSVLDALALQRSDLQGRISEATRGLDDAIKAHDDMAQRVRDSAQAFGSVLAVKGSEDNPLTVDTIAIQLRDRVAVMRQYVADITDLKNRGLNGDSLKELINAGPEAAAATARALSAGSADSLSWINGMQADLQRMGASLGSKAAGWFYQSGMDAAQGLLDGLTANESKITSAMEGLAQQMVAAVDRALGIASPSKVMAKRGGWTAQGFIKGVDGFLPAVQAAGDRMGQAIDPGTRASGWQPGAVPVGVGADPATAGGGTTIGQVTINAADMTPGQMVGALNWGARTAAR